VGQRSSTETVIGLVQAFLERRTWSQAELARRLGMTTPAVRAKLHELMAHLRLEREEDHPHVYWSVPKDWFPGGVLFTREQLPELLRQLSRIPRSRERDKLLQTILRHLPAGVDVAELPAAVVPPEPTEREQEYLAVVEDSASKKVPLRFQYFTASRGSMGTRHASVHLVFVGPAARFIATCHTSGTLKWFRVENIFQASLDRQIRFRPATAAVLEAFHKASLDGFNAGGETATLAFTVRHPEARWVANNLLPPMRVESNSAANIRVTVDTNALLQVARYVVGLGDAARAETPALAAAVRELARGALNGE
jgi:predicted DNA-binding transcriptional regulator YafY